MPFIRYTAKKILMITALSNTLAPMVKTYIRAGVIIESVIDCVRWASLACPGAFYIYENFLKKFLPEPNIGHYPLRSSGTGHRKGKGYQKITKKLDVKKENYAETFSCLLKDATNFLTFMELNIENLK